MKALAIKSCIVLIFSVFFTLFAKGQDSLLIPKHISIQHAGSIGYLSIGAGYDLFRNKRGSLEFVYGHVPKSKGGPLNIVSIKFAYRPFEVKITDGIQFYPINPGLFLSYHFGDQFDISFDHQQYEKSYYGWSTAIRGHISVSNEIKLDASAIKLKHVKLYSEFNVSDLYLASFFFKNNSKWLSPGDIIKLGIGVKVGF
ncbi:MAG: hypothetical protein ACO1N7_08580 [Sphingobacteriaceae bacterium]